MSTNCMLSAAMDSISLSKPTSAKEKPKRRNSEKRKEKSRKAARERRSQESKIFDQIEDILPVSSKTLEHLDKASLVRIAINYLKIRSIADPLKVTGFKDAFDLYDCSSTNTLNGLVFILSKDGDIVYLPENVDRHLGLTYIDMIGQSIYDYSHPCDHDDIKLFLEPLSSAYNASRYLAKPTERPLKNGQNAFEDSVGPYFIRMKSTLTQKGRNLNLKSANFKVMKFTGRMMDLETASPENAQLIGDNCRQYMIAIAEFIQHPSRIEIPLKTDVFMSKHSPDMKFTYADDSIEELFGFKAKDMIDASFYNYFDANDFKLMNGFFKTLFAKGQCDSGFYKFLVKTGGYRWISTQATVINEPNSNKPQSIILINRVISGVENAHLITSDVQQQSAPLHHIAFESNLNVNQPVSATASVIKPKSRALEFDNRDFVPAFSSQIQKAYDSQIPLKPFKAEEENHLNLLAAQLCPSTTENCISSTATVLAPKTADMESGFLMFTDDNKGMTVLTDADDLTHLAPDAGDLCVPMLPDMDFNDLSLFDDIFFNSTAFNINGANILSEDDLLTSLASFDAEKYKIDNYDTLNIEPECNLKKFDGNLLAMNGKEMPEIKSSSFDQQYPLANDPFLSFGNQNDELLMSTSPMTTSSSLMSEHYSSSSNSPSGSPSSRMTKSSSCDEMIDKSLCDTTDFPDDKDLEMRAPFIPIDDDFLLNDFASYSDSNMDDLFNWISIGGSNNNKTNNKSNESSDMSFNQDNSSKGSKPKVSTPVANKNSGGCLEALLQNDELVCNLKNKMYNSNQLLNRASVPQQAFVTSQAHLQSPQKRKNSNILIYTTLNSGEKKFKNIVLNTDTIEGAKLSNKSTVHHFVLTKNNELIPKSNFANQSFKLSSKRVLPLEPESPLCMSLSPSVSEDMTHKEDPFFKKPRQEPDKNYSNSVLLNLLVNGADLPNGYELTNNEIAHSYQGKVV